MPLLSSGVTPGHQHHSIYTEATDWMQPFEPCITEISICSHSGWHYHCFLTLRAMNEKLSWELVHCCVTNVTEQWQRQVLGVLGSFILARVTGQFIVRLKLFPNGNCPLDWNTNPMLYANPLLQKKMQPDINYIWKNTWCRGEFSFSVPWAILNWGSFWKVRDRGGPSQYFLADLNSVIFGCQVSKRFRYCRRDQAHFTTLPWQNNGCRKKPHLVS